MPHLGQRRRKLLHAFRYPDQRPHGIAKRRRIDQALERGHEPWVILRYRPTPAPGAANLTPRQWFRVEIILAAVYRRAGEPGNPRNLRQTAPTSAPHLARRKQSSTSLVKLRANRFPSLPNRIFVDHATDLPPFVEHRNPRQPSHSDA